MSSESCGSLENLTSCPPIPVRWGASRSQSALHMHVLVCICSNVRQFDKITDMIQVCYHTIACTSTVGRGGGGQILGLRAQPLACFSYHPQSLWKKNRGTVSGPDNTQHVYF